jgi:hypothetical protein
LVERPVAAATFAWLDLHRQVRVRGSVDRVSDAESDEYFASRPRSSQIGAWASPQSDVIADRSELEGRVTEVEARFGDGVILRPPHWGGWRVTPTSGSSGRAARAASTTASPTVATETGGWSCGWHPDRPPENDLETITLGVEPPGRSEHAGAP